MSTYTDKNGAELKEGDFFFYTEDFEGVGTRSARYADALCKVVRHPETGELGSTGVVWNSYPRHPMSYGLCEGEPDYVAFKFFPADEMRLRDCLKVEVEGDPVEFMNKNFPL